MGGPFAGVAELQRARRHVRDVHEVDGALEVRRAAARLVVEPRDGARPRRHPAATRDELLRDQQRLREP